MKLFERKAEPLLLEKARNLSAQHDSWRCLHINFSCAAGQFSEGLRTHVVTAILRELLEGDDGYIYFCEDGDIVILFHGKPEAILDRIGPQFKELGGEGEDSLYAVLDLSTQWQAFFELCARKAEAVAAPLTPAQSPKPAGKAPLPEIDAALYASMRHAARKHMRVLVVEDDPFTRKLVCSTLKGHFEVLEAGSAAEAIAQFSSGAPDAVFLDIELPDYSGHAVLGRMLGFDPTAFIVMLSANSVKENILAALEKGAKGFVAKPFTKEKLLHYLRQAAQRDPTFSKGALLWA